MDLRRMVEQLAETRQSLFAEVLLLLPLVSLCILLQSVTTQLIQFCIGSWFLSTMIFKLQFSNYMCIMISLYLELITCFSIPLTKLCWCQKIAKLMPLILQGHLNENFNALENFGQRHNLEFYAEGALNLFFERTAKVLTDMEQEL